MTAFELILEVGLFLIGFCAGVAMWVIVVSIHPDGTLTVNDDQEDSEMSVSIQNKFALSAPFVVLKIKKRDSNE